MKVVHCLGWYFPESVGGTEVYVRGLCRDLAALGVDVAIMAPCDGRESAAYVHDGVPVFRYPVPVALDADQLAGRAPHKLFDVFQRQLAELHADVFHMHSLTTGCGLPHLSYARELGLRTLLTAHVPGIVCARGTMLRFGREACDGRIDPHQCVPCWLDAKRVPAQLAKPLGVALRHMPALVGTAARGSLRTMLRSPARIEQAAETLRTIAARSDCVVVVCEWLRDALLANGLQAEKLRFCRQGVRAVLAPDERGPLRAQDGSTRLRVGYFGRGAWVKGLDLIVDAIRALPPTCPVELVLRAVPNNDDDRAYLARVRSVAASDTRIRFADSVSNDSVQAAMRECDVVAVPSRWLETGPLVAMEALAAGIPVLGSNLGGLRELIEPGRTGWLLPPDDLDAWTRRVAALALPGAATMAWDAATTPVITSAEVAQRMLVLYREESARGS